MLPFVVVISIGVVLYAVLHTWFARVERFALAGSFAAHFVGTGALMYMHETRGSDMEGYERGGVIIARLLRLDFTKWAPEVLNMLLQRDTLVPLEEVRSTGSMRALCGLAFFLTGGESLGAACLLVSFFAFVGQALLYRVARESLSASERTLAAVGILLVPSVVFWTSGLVKEAWSLLGLGMLAFGLHTALAKRRVVGVLLAPFGALLVGLVKPYTLFPFVLAAAAWMFSTRGKRVHPAYLVVGLVVAVVGIVAIGRLFPEFGIDRLGTAISRQRFYGAQAGGGSYIGDAEDADALAEGSLATQLRFFPIAIVNSLFRPVLFEARNAPQFVAAIENAVLLVLLLSLLWRAKMRNVARAVVSEPVVLASFVFVLSFGAAIGLASTNLGSLSRYRAPMMPMYVASLLILGRRAKRSALVPQPVRPGLRLPRPNSRASTRRS